LVFALQPGVNARLDDLRTALCVMEKNCSLHFAALMVTDIVGGTDRLVMCGESHHLGGLRYAHRGDGIFEMPDVVSRKKQLLPAIPQCVAILNNERHRR
jgi:inorganic pyrophosphatase/exopolyphosphatase